MFGLGKKRDPSLETPQAAVPAWQGLVDRLMLQPHPKGGFYRETYRSKDVIPPGGGRSGPRPASTTILYLLPAGAQTALARMKTDEIVHFYLGGPMTFVKISPSGLLVEIVLGQDLAAGHQLQHAIEAGWWFGGYCNPGTPFSLIGCTVSPGFDFADNEFADRAALIKEFPQARAAIERFSAGPAKSQ